MKCKLCLEKEANRKNTHYLTDSVIRSCLNYDGSNDREKGLYFPMATNESFVDFSFQRNTPAHFLEDQLKRPIEEEEIDRSKVIPFSVDYEFCNDCENLFGFIENEFLIHFFSKLRDANLSEVNEVVFIEKEKEARLFFLLQIFRTGVCDSSVNISKEVVEELRNILLNHKEADLIKLRSYPILITYLETIGDKIEFTKNSVGILSGDSPVLIFMNDLNIQFYESFNHTPFLEFFNLNNQTDYLHFLSVDNGLIVKIIHNQERKKLNIDYGKYIMFRKMEKYAIYFVEEFDRIYNKTPSINLVEKFCFFLIDQEYNIGKYSKSNLDLLLTKFLKTNLHDN